MKETEAALAILGGCYRGVTHRDVLLETEAEFHSGTEIPENEKILFMLESMLLTGLQFSGSFA